MECAKQPEEKLVAKGRTDERNNGSNGCRDEGGGRRGGRKKASRHREEVVSILLRGI